LPRIIRGMRVISGVISWVISGVISSGIRVLGSIRLLLDAGAIAHEQEPEKGDDHQRHKPCQVPMIHHQLIRLLLLIICRSQLIRVLIPETLKKPLFFLNFFFFFFFFFF
jgi:hypothetical protein